MKTTYDEKHGTDYEGKVHLGGKFFRPLTDLSPLSPITRERLIRFQSAMPRDAFGFIFVPSHIIKVMLNTDDEYVLGRYIEEDSSRLTILVILGDKIYERKKYGYNDIGDKNRLRIINRRFAHTQKVVTRILETGKKMLGGQGKSAYEILVVHVEAIGSLLAPYFIMESLGESESWVEDGPGYFYRLR